MMASRYRKKEIEIRAHVKDVTHRKAPDALFLALGSSLYQLAHILMKVKIACLHLFLLEVFS